MQAVTIRLLPTLIASIIDYSGSGALGEVWGWFLSEYMYIHVCIYIYCTAMVYSRHYI